MLLGDAENPSLPVLTDPVQHWRNNSNQDVDRTNGSYRRAFNNALCCSQIVASPGVMELMLNVPQGLCEFEV
jgi:hypothetical protein